MKADLATIAGDVEARLKQLAVDEGPFPGTTATYFVWAERRHRLVQALKAELAQRHGAAFSESSGAGHSVRLAGIRSSSTIGPDVALRNWVTAARKRLEG